MIIKSIVKFAIEIKGIALNMDENGVEMGRRGYRSTGQKGEMGEGRYSPADLPKVE